VIPTILLKDGYFVGHSFRSGGMKAVHLTGGDAVKFYGVLAASVYESF